MQMHRDKFCAILLTINHEYSARKECIFQKSIFLFINQNIYCGYSKEPFHGDGSFEHPKQMFEQIDKKIFDLLLMLIMNTVGLSDLQI